MFNDEGHKYYMDNEKLIGVTTVLSCINKPALVPWASNMCADYVKDHLKPGIPMDEVEIKTMLDVARKAHTQRKVDAGNVGSLAHDWIDGYIKGENPEMPFNEDLKKSVNKFLKWQEDYKVKFLLSEQVVYSKKHNFCGTLDFIAKIGDDLVLLDFKTSSGIWPEYWLQVFAYWLARTEEFPEENYKSVGVLRIGRVGEIEFVKKDIKDNLYLKDGFLAALSLYHTLENMKKESGRY